MKAYGFIHTHSEYSLKDAPLKLADIVKEAKKMGATAIALTDHGTAAGWIEFYDLCKNEGIKPILGVEAYIRSETNSRTHLILLAKNYTGYKEISQAISDSNENIERIADMDIPIMTKEILQKYLHGDNVIVTSACVSGVLSEILLSRKKIQEQVDSIKKKMDDYYSPYDTGYLKNKELVSSLDTEIAKLTAKKEKLEIIAKRNFREQKKSLSIYKKEDLSLYEERKKQLEKEEQETKEAKKSVSEIKKQIQNKKRSRTLINGRCKDAEKKQQKYIEAEAEICELTKKLTTEEGAIQKVKKEISWYTSFLGESFYIELQNHGLAEEAYVMPILASIAKEMKIPLVASNDVHILRKEDADIRQFIRSLRFKKYEEIGIADKELYMKDDKELSNALLKILPKDAVLKAMKGIKNICDSCNLVIPDTKHYPRYRDGNGNIVADSAALLRKKTLEGIPQRYPDGMDDERTKQMEYELNIIINMGYADYLLIVADYVNYAKEYSKKIGKGIGYGVGPGRGSGAGCIVNYLLGITDVEPVTYGLLFQRFLNPERVSMPDIDVDFSEEVREATIDYCRRKYGIISVAGIRTVGTQQGKMVVRNAARFLGWKYPDEKEKYQQLGSAIASAITSSVNKEIDEIRKEFSDSLSENILSIATRAEGIANSFGVHAAGVIIGDGQPLKEIIPLLYNALSTAQALAKSTWQNEYAMTNPLQVLDITETEQKHLLYHFMAFSADVTKEDVYGVREYKYCTVLLPEEFVAYTHLPRISEGGIFTIVQDIPKFSVPSMLKGEIYMGTILNPERFTFKNGYRTPYDYRIDESCLMHGYFTGASRSGKTVAAMRFIAELSKVRRSKTGKRLRIVAMDPKQDWRTLARFVEPERFNFYSLGNLTFRPIKINPWKIPHGVWPQLWIDGVIDIYCRAYGLLERGKQMIADVVFELYEEAGVFNACDKPDWKETTPELSKKVNFHSIYRRMEEKKAEMEGKRSGGNDTKDAYARLLERLSCFAREYSIECKLYGTSDGIGIDDLIGDDDVTVLESKGLENTFKNFIFGVITSGFYKYAVAHEGGFLADDQYETVLVIEEANEVLIGTDTSKGDNVSLSGESEFEQILDQSAGYGLFVFAITQKIADMPSSIIANAGIVFAGKLKRPEDISVVVRAVGREERIDDRDLVKWFPRSPIGYFVCQTSRSFDFKDAEPVLVQISRLNINPPSNLELDEIILQKEIKQHLKEIA